MIRKEKLEEIRKSAKEKIENLKDLKRWKNAEEVLKHKIIVLPRGDIDINLELKEYNKDNFVVAKDFDYLDVSSTEVRNGNTDNMDVRVLKYIKDNKFYTRQESYI